MDGRYADCERITLICDNLNTHANGAFYEVFPAERARQYFRRIGFVYTPKHGSWLNVADCELGCLTRQCLAGIAWRSYIFFRGKLRRGRQTSTLGSAASTGK
ncbi:hypothetical protein THTE_4227 [Thermogutta terrifontis]|uniref:Tc1-like transposase DDE domain-containing protein n=1 Tax=Thermogutta terrifontis TaxID=1331910 RepID=A0A286RLJ3_9BACT|nr:transposase [Thermogutta terrifontis]ASV76828.1 hypothetical protein THTE_4227 [Thermogutta terrifontis]